jgi:thiol-disulfide isomerase/thioredoxin
MVIRSILLGLLLASSAMADQTVQLKTMSSGAMDIVGGSYYLSCKLSETKPPNIKKLPDGLSEHPLYGQLKFVGPGVSEIAVIVDSPEGKPSRLFVDSNGNGDLTDDPATEWVSGPDYKGTLPGLKPANLANVGGATVQLGTADKKFDAHLGMWQYNPAKMTGRTPAQQDEMRKDLRYYRDYYTTGKITVDNKPHDAFLLDEMASGTFALTHDGAMVRLFIDLNDNGKLDAGEMFDAAKPLKINDNSYEVKNISPDGTSFDFGPSTKVAYGPDDVLVGKTVPAFTAKDLAGNTVNFPGDFKGKIVMLDFWATWCAPCMAEVPTVVAAYNQHHTSGFEILGVTLDQATDGDKVKKVTADHQMAWPELFGDAGKSHAVADMFSVNAIPSAFLVDGTTGKILAVGNDLRGEGLEKELAKFATTQPAGK